jgi:hypothetical protein
VSECRNDCKAPLLFPKPISNRPGLRRIDYRIGTYSDFREALLRKLNLDPVLAPWNYRGSDDLGIALIEGASILADILTFYQDLYANELYLPTATLAQSVAGLVRLAGYRLSPGVGGQGVFAFEVTGVKPVTIPAGFPVTADVMGLPETATFETTDNITAVPALSKFALYGPFSVPSIVTGATKFAVNTADLDGVVLEKGNRLMLMDPARSTAPDHQVAVIDKVEPRFEQTEITIKGSWRGRASSTLTAYKLGRDFRHFGHNAPPKETVVTGGQASQQEVNFKRLVGPWSLHVSSRTSYEFPLDSQVDDLSAGTTVLIGLDVIMPGAFKSRSAVFVIRQIAEVRKASETRGSLTGASSVVVLDEFVTSVVDADTDIRSVQIHETTGGPLSLTAPRNPITGPLSQLYFFGNGDEYRALEGRRLQLQRNKPTPGRETAVEEVTAAVTPSAVGNTALSTLRPVTLQPAPQKFTIDEFPHSLPKDSQPVLVFGNLASATQGKTEKPVVLGSGDARATFQTFPIPKAPLTYLLSKSATPPEEPKLAVTVDNLEWKQVPSLITAGPKDQVYIVREDSSGQSFVQFGDGETGARLPSGLGNVACTYRTGVGAYGPVKPGASADAGGRITGLDGVLLLDETSGGTQPEALEKARQCAPGKIQSLGRLVSLRDFETETLGIPGVSAASANWQIIDNVPAVGITVLMETGRCQ